MTVDEALADTKPPSWGSNGAQDQKELPAASLDLRRHR